MTTNFTDGPFEAYDKSYVNGLYGDCGKNGDKDKEIDLDQR